MMSRLRKLFDRDGAGDGRRELDAALEARLRAHFRDGRTDAEQAAARVLARLSTRVLPPQRRPRFAGLWPAALLTSDFGPAWPRVAALAAVAALGFALGSMDFARMQNREASTPLGYSIDGDLSGILFDDDV